jgi:hypothetical protein
MREFNLLSSPPTSVIKRQNLMNSNFTRVHSMNAISTRANFRRRKSHRAPVPVLVLVALASAVTYVTLLD